MSLEISKMLTLSTGHLTMTTGEILHGGDATIQDVPDWYHGLCVNDMSDGWLIWCGDALDPTAEAYYPDDIRAGIALARKAGCDWIHYDNCGPMVKGLPYEDW